MHWIDTQFVEMVALVEKWANINSFSENAEGLEKMYTQLSKSFARLDPDEMRAVPFPYSQGLFLKKRANAPIQIFFGGHFDTVFPPSSSFQKVTQIDESTLCGPGTIDMKGGLVVMLKSIEAFERSTHAENIGWEIFLNPDEEIGSPYSTPTLQECAKRCDLALIFEPALPGGEFASSRKGSLTLQITSKGKAAHAGRNPEKGKNAILPLAQFIVSCENYRQPGLLINIGTVKGGESVNIIPSHAECLLNIRADDNDLLQEARKKIQTCAEKHHLQVHLKSQRPPKPFDVKTEELFLAMKTCGEKLGLKISWKPTGGVCDGNTLAALGVPTLDTLGVSGKNAHSEEESIDLKSLIEKTKLTALFLEELAEGNIILEKEKHERRC